MSRIDGYAGSILRVDLSARSMRAEATQGYVPQCLGGRGLNQWILLREMEPTPDPFDPRTIICFGAGALAGTMVPGAARINIDSRNALTAGIGSGNAGGWFASELKFAGYDAIVVVGRAERPVYLWIEDGRASLRSAEGMWGKRTDDTIAWIHQDLGREDLQVLNIGPAGEHLSRSACIMVSRLRAVGRCGLGAVMGSKNLKAIAVRGTGCVTVKEPEAFMALVDEVSRRLQGTEGARGRREYGTVLGCPSRNELSGLAFKNFQDDHIPDPLLRKISPDVFRAMIIDRHACCACPTACGHLYGFTDEAGRQAECLKSEANAVWNFGGKLAVDDPHAVLQAQEECCQLGLDIDNASSVIGWAMDCYQNGLLSRTDTDGLELRWGDHRVIGQLLRKIAYREGFGDLLAEGAYRASGMVGKGTERYAFHIKGQDLIEAIRALKGWALGVVVSARGGAHTRGACNTETIDFDPQRFGLQAMGGPASYEGKPEAVRYFEYVHCLGDSLGVCFFTTDWVSGAGITPKELARFYSLATGNETSEGEMMRIAERIHNVEKMFNVCHAGFTRQDDYPPERLMNEPVRSGSLKGERLAREDWDAMLDAYYRLHGWDTKTGWPTPEKLRELDLQECLQKLEEATDRGSARKQGGPQQRGRRLRSGGMTR